MSKRSRPRSTSSTSILFPDDHEEDKLLKPQKKKLKKQETSISDSDGEPHSLPTESGRIAIKNGFRMLPIHVGDSSVIKYWYYREQKSANKGSEHGFDNEEDSEDGDEVPEDARTIFVTNLCSDCTEADLRNVFEQCGVIEHVRFDSLHAQYKTPNVSKNQNMSSEELKPTKGQELLAQHRQQFAEESQLVKFPFESHGYALVVFKSQKGLLRALNGLRLDNVQDAREYGHKEKGIARWFSEYKSLYLQDGNEIQDAVDSYMTDYDKRKKQERKMAEELATVEDDDGWTVVVRRGKKKASGSNNGKEATVGTATISKEKLLKRKEKESDRLIDSFYRFQKQEEKRKRLDELRRKFEMDKRRIQKIKTVNAARKFKPT